jgi:serine/threonine-protein kinase
MSAPLDCPEIECWQELLDDALPPEQEERLERHLESCLACQERLHRAEGCAETLRSVGRQFGDPTTTPRDPILTEVLERLQQVKSPQDLAPAGPSDLYFLNPTDRPELLGTLDEYEVQEVIGEGGFGVVLKAYEPALHRLVAIKVLSPSVAGSATARRRFTREAQAAAAVCHDHIVAVHAVREASGLPYLVMQYVAGESLQDRLDRTGPLEVLEIVRIGMQTAQGLAAAHAQGLIHRDIKPANLLLENGLARVKITDFGLARMADDVHLTQNGTLAGTPEYMAPEQARGEVIDHRADLFSLGSVLSACCTGIPPFRGTTALAVLRQVNDESPPAIREWNPEVPAWLEALITRLMAKAPDARFQSAAEVAVLLEGYLAHLRQPATVPAPELPFVIEVPGPGRCPERATAVLRWLRISFWLALPFLALTAILLADRFFSPNTPGPAQELRKEFYQDFRGRRGLHPALSLSGPDTDEVSTPEPEGLRIKLPPTRPEHSPVEVVTTFALSGDFEITGTYELLAASQPTAGYGVGVSLNLADGDDRQKFAKVARCMLPRIGSVFQSEHWTQVPRKDYQTRSKPTDSRIGQLRLVRRGSSVRYLAADGLEGKFEEIWAQDNFGTDDLAHVHFVVADSGAPGNAVDVRLVDLTIRAFNLIPDPTADAAPVSAGATPERPARPKGWLTAAAILGLVLLSALAVCLVVRQRRREPTEEDEGPSEQAPVPGEASGGRHPLSSVVVPVVLLLVAVGAGVALLVPSSTEPGEPAPTREVYQDFRGGKPLLADFTMDGDDADQMAHPEEAGLRITMPAARRNRGPVGALAAFPVSGDFEITGTFELLSADQPSNGNGVGIALNICSDHELRNFAKLGRFLRWQEGSVFILESWNKDHPGSYRVDGVPTEVRSGALRLVRRGSTLIYLVNDGPDAEFRELHRAEFGTDDLALCRFVVNNSGSPFGVDARLLDFRVRYGQPAGGPVAATPKRWLTVVEILALVLALAGLGGWFFLPRQRRSGQAPAGEAVAPVEPAAAPVIVSCPACGKKLKVRAELAGKKVKCSGCGRAVAVPQD